MFYRSVKKVARYREKSQAKLAQPWLEDGRAVAKSKGVAMEKLAVLLESLRGLSLAELRLVLKFAEWLKEQQGSGVAD
ncbi:hypothetical protein ES703_115241 [subsurface metagenome]